MKIRTFFAKLLSNGLVTATIALGVGILGMLALLKGYDAIWGEGPTSSVAVNEIALPDDSAEEGPEKTLYVRGFPVPFLDQADGKPIGYVWVTVAVKVAGDDAYQALSDGLDPLLESFTETLAKDGAGRRDEPGIVDYDRLAKTFLTLARDGQGLQGIRQVTVSADEGA